MKTNGFAIKIITNNRNNNENNGFAIEIITNNRNNNEKQWFCNQNRYK